MKPRDLVRKYREESGLSQKEFGRLLGCDGSYICLIERGRRVPGLRVAMELAKLGVCEIRRWITG
jgi:transcriptional regulator with XRE-family HTH domain